MPLSDVQAGRAGEYLHAVYAMLTSQGELVPFQVDADDDHRDLVVAIKGKSALIPGARLVMTKALLD
ncbi:MAG TPA: hypothetical protein VNA65_03700 [Candidatus Dormibacteraeota bacterium]|nr:hypothetical protein [Candidatus Dormibacteraeota bacterium]